LHQLKQERSNLVHTARDVIDALLGPEFGFERKIFQSNLSGRENNTKLQALLQNPMKPSEKYPLDAPILFPNQDCTNIGHIFEVKPLSGVSASLFLT